MNYAINPELHLTPVLKTPDHIAALFSILDKREGDHVISHNQHTDFKTHREFVFSHPYRYWFLVECQKQFVGTVYLTNENVIGVFIEHEHLGILEETLTYVLDTFDPLPKIPSVRSPEFTINIAPRNTTYARIVQGLGGRLIQETYILTKNTYS